MSTCLLSYNASFPHEVSVVLLYVKILKPISVCYSNQQVNKLKMNFNIVILCIIYIGLILLEVRKKYISSEVMDV